MSSALDRNAERFAHAQLRVSLALGWCAVKLLIAFAPLLKKKKSSKDFLFFPYTHKDNIGTRSRFQEYFPLLEKDGLVYDVHYPSTREEYMRLYHSDLQSRIEEFRFYSRLFWQRLTWILKAPDYKAVFFQRTLFPEYYDQRNALLEQLLRAYHDNVIVDFYDADYARNEPFYKNVIRRCDKVTVVNKPLSNYFGQHHPRVLFNNLSVDATAHQTKNDFVLHQPVRIFWTGSVANAQAHLVPLMPVLEKLNATQPLKLVLVSINNAGLTQPFVEHHTYESHTFNKLMRESDIAIYAAQDDDVFTRGKVAYKHLEYAATKIPMVASPFGLSEHFIPGEDVLVAHSLDEWLARLQFLINDQTLRERLAHSAYQKLLQHHDTKATYQNFLSFLMA
ncbi:MAG TPA: glycosyltransferase [Chitinophagales bacterium]|nr:glycosyltransferase [Chitinophagales bacterium]